MLFEHCVIYVREMTLGRELLYARETAECARIIARGRFCNNLLMKIENISLRVE